MKKFFAMMLSLVLAFSMSAALADDNVLTMVTNASFPPYEFYDGEDITGIDVDICAAIAEKLGMEFEVRDAEFDAILSEINQGKADVGMAGMTVTEERQQMVNFSSSYATGIQAVIVKEDSPIATVDDLFAEGADYKIGVQLSTTGDIYASDDFGDDRVVRYPNGNDATMALVAGKVDCVIIDNEPAKAYVAANEGLKVLETSYAVEDYAACFKKNNTELLEKFDAALKELIEDGTVAAIIGNYIKAE